MDVLGVGWCRSGVVVFCGLLLDLFAFVLCWGSSPSSLTLLPCLQAPQQDSRGVSKQYGEDADKSGFQITIQNLINNITRVTQNIEKRKKYIIKIPAGPITQTMICTGINCRPQPRQRIT
jgi:hypothetical protein